MLQQTQVKTVIPYFKKFIERYPDIDSISQASEDELLAIWSGLGFYKRAQNIFKAKEIIKNDFSNKFPDKFEEILMLPGIGRSTAGAIMAIAYKKSYPILDANVKRVITRYSGIDEFSKTKLDKALWLESTRLKADKKIFEIDLNKYDFSDKSFQKMREDFSSIYAVTDEKFKEVDFNNKVKKENQL